jgi:hypothetical protein
MRCGLVYNRDMSEEPRDNGTPAAWVMIGAAIGYAVGSYVAPVIPGSLVWLAIMMSCVLIGAGIGLGISTRIFN